MNRPVQLLQGRRKTYQLWLTAFLVLLVMGRSSRADDESDVKRAAADFNIEFDSNQMNKLYDDFAGQFVRSKVTKAAYVSQLAIFYANLGGAARSRTIIQQQHGPDPGSGNLMYSFRYNAEYPAATVYQDLTFIRENPAGWKLYGIFFYPVPAQ